MDGLAVRLRPPRALQPQTHGVASGIVMPEAIGYAPIHNVADMPTHRPCRLRLGCPDRTQCRQHVRAAHVVEGEIAEERVGVSPEFGLPALGRLRVSPVRGAKGYKPLL